MDQFLGQLTLASFSFAPKGWALCNGQLLPVSQNQALFSLIGTSFGGNGSTTFALPDLRGRVALGSGSSYTLGQMTGTETVTLLPTQLPPHTHSLTVSGASGGNLGTVQGNTVGMASGPAYAKSANAVMASGAISMAGSSQGHENRSPFVVLNWIIALQGIYPTRN